MALCSSQRILRWPPLSRLLIILWMVKHPLPRDLPGNPVVKTSCLHGRGRGFYGWSKYWDAACHIVKQNKQTNKQNRWPDPWINLDALNQNFWASSWESEFGACFGVILNTTMINSIQIHDLSYVLLLEKWPCTVEQILTFPKRLAAFF